MNPYKISTYCLCASLALVITWSFRSQAIHWTETYRVDGDMVEVKLEGNPNMDLFVQNPFTQTVTIWHVEERPLPPGTIVSRTPEGLKEVKKIFEKMEPSAEKLQFTYSFKFKGPMLTTPLLRKLDQKQPAFAITNLQERGSSLQRNGDGTWAVEQQK